MILNPHYELRGKHAFLSPSSPYWLKYDENKLTTTWANNQAKELGTRIHAVAAELIDLGIKLPRSKKTLNLYVNDAISFGMTVEQPLYFSDNCFGTADCISFKDKLLRIHDLKTGETPAKMEQLKIYDALFCLEYAFDPIYMDHELRIYQNNEVTIEHADPQEIIAIMNHIIWADGIIDRMKGDAKWKKKF